MNIDLRFFCITIAFTFGCIQAGPTSQSRPLAPANTVVLDTAKLHQTYREGDFDILIDKAEAVLNSGVKLSSIETFFIHKHLAVVYANNPDKRETAKYHMVRLLNIHPDATLYDMDASDAVYSLFDRVKAENDVRMGRSSNSSRASMKSPDKNTQSHDNRSSKAWVYWLGGVAAVGAGIGITAYLWPEPEPTIKIQDNPLDNRSGGTP